MSQNKLFLQKSTKRIIGVLILLGVAALVFFLSGNKKSHQERSQTAGKQQESTEGLNFESGTIPKDAWPDSWFKDPKTASQLNINEYNEAPVLAEKVKQGELPPVEERLPDDPIVVEPYDRVGEYGGTARMASKWQSLTLNQKEAPLRIGPQAVTVRNNLIAELEVSDDSKVYKLHLRKGIKWSDGHPHTADDYVFWFKHVHKNNDLTPKPGAPFYDDARIRKIDDYTVEYEFPEPNVYFDCYLAHLGYFYRLPKHFMKDYHPAFNDSDEVEEEAKERGFVNWVDYFYAAKSGAHGGYIFERPVLRAFRLVQSSPQRNYYKRNPYYPKVDPDGNQLPYIDNIIQSKSSQELIVPQAAAGELSISGEPFTASDLPFLLSNEESGGYTTYLWRRYLGSEVVMSFNQTYPDPEVRDLLSDVKFRRALSLAIDREEINDILYFGKGIPRNMFVAPMSKFYEEEVARGAYIDHDPAEAKRLLDELGIVDKTGNGMRNRPGGGKLNLVVEVKKDYMKDMELVVEHWREIGLDIQLRQITLSLYDPRARSNQVQIGVWHGDRVGDTLFPIQPAFFVPTTGMERISVTWGRWRAWFESGGEEGEEPPEKVKKLKNWWEEMRSTPQESRRIELGKKIMRSQAENLWAIGVVGFTPKPIMVSNNLHNVPKRGYWDWDTKFNYPYHPETYFLSSPEDK